MQRDVNNAIRRATIFTIGVLLLYAVAIPLDAATITVTNTNDSGPGSLRQALANANNGDTINFAVTGTVSLFSGELVIGKNVTIAGPGANRLSIDGGQELGSPYTFHVVSGKTVTISGLTITGDGGGIRNDEAILTVSNCVVSGAAQQAGLLNSGVIASVTIINSLFSDNSEGIYNNSGGSGAGNCTACTTIANSVVTGNTFGVYTSNLASSVTVLNSRLTGNSLDAINTSGNAEITVQNSTISGSFDGILTRGSSVSIANSTISGNSGFGGVYAVGGDLSIVNSTISGNLANTLTGGGIYGEGLDDLSIVNSTISGNSAGIGGSGGGIYNLNSSLRITNSTITGNSAGSGGGIYNDGGSSVLGISNTILNAGASGENIFNNGGTVSSDGYNLSSDDGGGYLNGPGDQINTDPLLGPLQNNGGPTLTHALLPGSPAIDAGDPNFTPPPFHDQRGPCYYRVFGRSRRIDIGSVETQPERPCPNPPRPRPTPP